MLGTALRAQLKENVHFSLSLKNMLHKWPEEAARLCVHFADLIASVD